MVEIVGVVLIAVSIGLSWLVKRPVKCEEVKSVEASETKEVVSK